MFRMTLTKFPLHRSVCRSTQDTVFHAVSFAGVSAALCMFAALSVGCGKDTEDSRIDDPADFNQPDSGALASQQIQPDIQSGGPGRTMPAHAIDQANQMAGATSGGGTSGGGNVGGNGQPHQLPFTIAGDDTEGIAHPAGQTEGSFELSPDLNPFQLVDFLGQADQFMQLLLSGRGITDRQEAFKEMNRVAKLKLEASRRLKDHPDAERSERSEGARGEMQALSHMAAQGDLKAADELKKLADINLKSADRQLASESRIVLIGFAIEAMQAGKSDAADQIVSLVDSVESSDDSPDVPALMMMGYARDLLAKYEFDEQAVKVRQRILDLFADSSNPDVAKMAAQAAGNVRFDTVEKLRTAVVAGTQVDKDQWAASVNGLIDESPDLATVQYLAGTAVELEAVSADHLAAATYDIMQQRFGDVKTATGREVELALRARAARERMIGSVYAPKLPSINGAPMPLSNYQGKVVLMPFWATGFPESLQVIPALQEIQKQHPNDVAIVGMNLDPADVRVEEFEPDKQLGFPSYRSVSSDDKEEGNPVATQFGMVSMPFVAILDQDQRIVTIDFTGSKLKSTVEKLLRK